MDFKNIQYGITEKNLGVLIFEGVQIPTQEIKDFIDLCSISQNFKFVKTSLGVGIVCPGLKRQQDLYFEAGEYWNRIIKRLDSPVEILDWK